MTVTLPRNLLLVLQDSWLCKAWAAERFAKNSDRLLGNQKVERGDVNALFTELVGAGDCMLAHFLNNTDPFRAWFCIYSKCLQAGGIARKMLHWP